MKLPPKGEYTGPYQTGYFEFSMPYSEPISKGAHERSFAATNEVQWVRVEVAAGTRISFYFYGSVDFEADMFTHLVYGSTTDGRIEWNTDSPSSSFRYTLYCAEAQTLYIRLRTYDGSTGTYTIRIS